MRVINRQSSRRLVARLKNQKGRDKKQLGPKSKRRLLHHVHKKAVGLTTLKWWLSKRRHEHLELESWRLTNQHASGQVISL